MFITFLTDFGLEDDFVGTCHGVIKRIAPDAQLIDITHGIRPGRILQGALALANALPYMPVGVHLAIVDPGVGSSRRPLALRDGEGRLYVGPDNGLLLPAAERFGGVVEAYELANPAYALDTVSRTFHGRDLFSPGRSPPRARGARPASSGRRSTRTRSSVSSCPRRRSAGRGSGRPSSRSIASGTSRVNLTRDHLDEASIVPGMRVELAARGNRYYAVAARTFADATAGELILYEDSYRNVAVAVTRGSAASLLGVEEGSELVIAIDAI